ncbi:MAG: AI-2E family transporter, partial [Luminiphilus sp.]|nr:AI-2E family transporter [Luminiphilus sp.]
MLNVLKKWYHRYLNEEESILLLALLVTGLVILLSVGDILTPFFVAVILAYLMQGIANQLQDWGLSARLSVGCAMALFISS